MSFELDGYHTIDVHEYFVVIRQASCGLDKSRDGLRSLGILGDFCEHYIRSSPIREAGVRSVTRSDRRERGYIVI